MRLFLLALAACGAPPASTTIANSAPSGKPAAVTLVFSEQEIWVGNEDHETDPSATYPGALHALETGLDHLSLPADSTIAVVGFSTGANVVVARKPAALFHGSELGIQRAYRSKIGTDLLQAVVLAGEELDRTTTPRRLLVIVSDGNDTNNDMAKQRFAEIAKRWANRIEVRAIIWRSPVSSDAEIVSTLAPHATVTIAATTQLADAVATAIR